LVSSLAINHLTDLTSINNRQPAAFYRLAFFLLPQPPGKID
jgi:hypothetical protein